MISGTAKTPITKEEIIAIPPDLKNLLDLSAYSVSTNSYGKPYLSYYPDFQYNISHSGNWVVAAVSDKSLGIDVEQIRDLDDFMDIAKRFYSEKEYVFLLEGEETTRLASFYDIWTKKESLIKAIGEGLSIPLQSFTVPFTSGGKIDYKGNSWRICIPEFCDEHYKISICSSYKKLPFAAITYIKLDELA